ncbi:hypothetical protein ACLMJK_003042 [Lecanora helva]
MILSSLLSAGAFGLAAQAFLVLPETNSLPEIEDKAPTALDTSSKTINVDCSTCPYALKSQRNGAHEWTGQVASELELNFASADNTLKLNDVIFYPLQNPTLPPRLTVAQRKKDGEVSTMEGLDGRLGLSYSMEYNEKKFKENSLVTIVMTIMGLEGQMIKVDNVEIKAIKEADGKLHLHSITTVPASPNAPDAKCENILCRVFTKLIAGAHKAKATAKGAAHRMKCVCMKCFHKLTGHKHAHHKGNMAVPHRRPDGTIELPTHIQFKPMDGHRVHAHHNHHHRGFLARMGMVLRTTVKVVFVPILIGVAFGMAASAIGMLVGQAVVFIWMKLRRTPETGAYERVETDEKEVPPPAYTDVQGVEAINEKEVDAKA